MGLYWLLLDLSNIYPFIGGDSSKSTLLNIVFQYDNYYIVVITIDVVNTVLVSITFTRLR